MFCQAQCTHHQYLAPEATRPELGKRFSLFQCADEDSIDQQIWFETQLTMAPGLPL